ncbi:hypothetical protein C5167_005011 [Papaver somniferum]|uniref:Uncharacterized protein n=1 Tax=Papaver somniferum TaxID=3469 RepID=A0A4Y7JB25_PAPSO|nr:hypothetical protein C5167_005011 [Papaver somniferum]
MCLNASQWDLRTTTHPHQILYMAKKPRVRIQRLKQNRARRTLSARRRRLETREMRIDEGREIELKNLILYLENKSIIEENQKLKEKALLLHQENRELMSQLQKISKC